MALIVVPYVFALQSCNGITPESRGISRLICLAEREVVGTLHVDRNTGEQLRAYIGADLIYVGGDGMTVPPVEIRRIQLLDGSYVSAGVRDYRMTQEDNRVVVVGDGKRVCLQLAAEMAGEWREVRRLQRDTDWVQKALHMEKGLFASFIGSLHVTAGQWLTMPVEELLASNDPRTLACDIVGWCTRTAGNHVVEWPLAHVDIDHSTWRVSNAQFLALKILECTLDIPPDLLRRNGVTYLARWQEMQSCRRLWIAVQRILDR